MPPSSILLGLTLLVLVVPFIAEPLLRSGRKPRRRLAAAGGRAGEAPVMAKDAALVAVRDLDFDFQTGKVAEADYRPLRQQLLMAAAEAAQREKPAYLPARPASMVEDDIEAAVRRLRRGGSATSGQVCAACGAALKIGDRFCGACGAVLGNTCPGCSAPVRSDDRFCAACGTALSTKVDIRS